MGQTLVQKILARASGLDSIATGEIVWAYPDLVTTPEVSFPAYVKRIRQVGVERLAFPERVVVAIDHEVPVHSREGAERNRLTRQLASELAVGHLYDGEGITHPLVIERGLVKPGMFVAAADTHTPSLGGVGALAVPFGFELTMIFATGKIWVKVPETIRVTLNGRPRAGVAARDIVLAVMRQLDPEEADYRVVEYQGEGLTALSIPERMTLCGLCIDGGAKSGIAAADAACVEFLAARGVQAIEPVAGDPDAVYVQEIAIDISALEPQVSIPPAPNHVRAVSELVHVAVQHAYIGSCASGTLQELRAAADLLEGRKVHPGVQMLVIPATREIYGQAMEQGILARLLAAGAQISAPTCGPCFGGLAQLAPGEVRISTSTRNDPGRMGSQEASIYLASALTVTATAIAGHIADPRSLLPGGEP